MSDKFDSLMFILNKLDAGKKVTCKSLMDDLEISERSVYRYITTLQVARFPIDYDRKRGTYTFSDGFSLKKPNISIEEALSLALAKQLVAPLGEKISDGISRIEERIASSRVSLPRHIVMTSIIKNEISAGIFQQLNQAITNHTAVKIKYKAVSDDKVSIRVLEPAYLFLRGDHWYLRAWCRTANANRTFGLDRIQKLNLLQEQFIPKDTSPDDELSGAFGAMIDGPQTEILLRFDKGIVSKLLRKKWHVSQKDKKLKDGRLELHFVVNGTESIKQWLYGWIPYVEVIKPESLRKRIQTELAEAIKRHVSEKK